MFYIFTGNGKGKTTAALGQAMRAVGEGKRVLMVQFIKGPWKSGEDEVEIVSKDVILNAMKDLKDSSVAPLSQHDPQGVFKLVKMGKGFVGILGDSLPREEHEKAAEDALAFARDELEGGTWDIVILDEVNNALALCLISEKEVLDFLHIARQKLQAIIFTGRDASPTLMQQADLVTEMKDIKHPYEHGIKGRRGLEY